MTTPATVRRIRCHGVVANGKVTTPAVVEIEGDRLIGIYPDTLDTHYSTAPYNGAIVVLPEKCSCSLPASLPHQGFRAALASIAPLTESASSEVEIHFIPLNTNFAVS